MHTKGYTKFKLIHQGFNFTPINLSLEKNPFFPVFLFWYTGFRLKFRNLLNSRYPYSSSGPLPENTKGEWMPYEQARQLFVDFYQGDKLTPLNSKSWFDFQATY